MEFRRVYCLIWRALVSARTKWAVAHGTESRDVALSLTYDRQEISDRLPRSKASEEWVDSRLRVLKIKLFCDSALTNEVSRPLRMKEKIRASVEIALVWQGRFVNYQIFSRERTLLNRPPATKMIRHFSPMWSRNGSKEFAPVVRTGQGEVIF